MYSKKGSRFKQIINTIKDREVAEILALAADYRIAINTIPPVLGLSTWQFYNYAQYNKLEPVIEEHRDNLERLKFALTFAINRKMIGKKQGAVSNTRVVMGVYELLGYSRSI